MAPKKHPTRTKPLDEKTPGWIAAFNLGEIRNRRLRGDEWPSIFEASITSGKEQSGWRESPRLTTATGAA